MNMTGVTKTVKSLLGIKDKPKEDKITIPKTVQQSIPYLGVYDNGIMQLDSRRYSKIYGLEEVNFCIESDERQRSIVMNYMDFLQSFGPDVEIQIVIYNKTINSAEFEQKMLIPTRNDMLNDYREEMNNLLISKMAEARNNIIHEKYVVVTIYADDIEGAKNTFSRIDMEMIKGGKILTNVGFEALSLMERLDLLHRIYNMSSTNMFSQRLSGSNGRMEDAFHMKEVRRSGLTSKDLIAPEVMEFERDYFRLGDTYGRSLFLSNLPSYLRGDFISDLSSMPFNMLISIHYRSMALDESIKKVKEKMVSINANVVDQQKKAFRNGYSAEMISPEIRASSEETQKLLDELVGDNQKLFYATICMTIFAGSMEQLDKYTKTVQATAERFVCEIKKLTMQQELGLNSSLPYGKNYLKIERMLNTRGAAAFVPFSVKEFIQEKGHYYGLNAVSKQLIILNRLLAKSGNGVILGTTGSGKSFKAKELIAQLILNATEDDEIFVIDPENEYATLAHLLGGSVIRIAAGSSVHINPMDMSLDYADDDDPISLKTDFINTICEAATNSRYPLSPVTKSIVDRCVRNVYMGYVAELRANGKRFDPDTVPTLRDFYDELNRQSEAEAKNMSLTLERFVNGTQNTFASRTNVDIQNRFVVYNIKDLGEGLKNIGLQICLDNIWNRTIENGKKGKRTWLFCDEFHLLTQTKISSEFTKQIWKRARKWGGIPTGMTQNAEDMLATADARAVINNCDFVIMLNLDAFARNQLQQMFNISDTELEYVTNAMPGQGLIYNGSDIIPFIDEFPEDTKLYRAMTTKPDDLKKMHQAE